MLQIQPDMDIVYYFIQNTDHKYVTALGMVYLRMVGVDQSDIFRVLEPYFMDYRKLRKRNQDGGYEIMYMDEFADDLLEKDIFLDINLSRLSKRHVLEEDGKI